MMNSKVKKQVSVLIGVAVLLILLIIAAVIFYPTGKIVRKKKILPGKADATSTAATEETQKFDITWQIFGTDGKPLVNAGFGISCGDTEFTTDENGYFRLNGLPVGTYELYSTVNGGKHGATEVVLTRDGCVTVGNTTFEYGATVKLTFNGKGFTAYVPSAEDRVNDPDEIVIVNPDDSVEEDVTYTDFSWMKDVPQEFGMYGLNTTWGPEVFYEVIEDPQYSYINTFLLESRHLEQTKKEAAALKKYGKRFWLNVGSLLTVSSGGDPATNLPGDWRERLNRWAAELYTVGGDNFQGFYFDEVDLYMSSSNFTRVTKYMREHFALRTFAIHRVAMFSLPASKGIPAAKYRPTSKEFCITKQNHKYVTDVGYWFYGGYRWYGTDPDRQAEVWKECMDMIDPNTRKWAVPPCGSYDWRHTENDCMDVEYEMYKHFSSLEGFGGLMLYAAGESSLWGAVGTAVAGDERLTDADYVKNPDGSYALDKDGNKIVELAVNNSFCNVLYGKKNSFAEGHAEYYVIYKLKDGDYLWRRARQYMEILGKGITGNEPRDSILSKLESVYKPDSSLYKCNKGNRE